jgi:S-adenosylmethionine:tRNA ribosyltransferase-isomerase
MHAELVTVDRQLLLSLLSGGRRIAVGTTTTRSLESVYWLGVKAVGNSGFSFDNLLLDQWDAYELERGPGPEPSEDALVQENDDLAAAKNSEREEPQEKEENVDSGDGKNAERGSIEKTAATVSLDEAIRTLLKKMDAAGIDSFPFLTRLMITPGYRFRVIDGLFTNFHQPKSTLLLLIAAVAGDDWRRIYDYAMEHEYRFLSYGDSSLLFVKQE